MNDKQINTLIKVFHGISALTVLIGALFKLQHYPNGLLILLVGFILGSVTSSFESFTQKKRIKSLEEELKQKK